MKHKNFFWSIGHSILSLWMLAGCKGESTADKIEDPALTSETSAKLEISGAAVFDDVYLNETQEKTITLLSKADYDLTSFSLNTLGSPFSINSNDCQATFPSRATCNIVLGFSPTEVDEYAATLVISYFDGSLKVNRTVDLSGKAISPGTLALTEKVWDLGLEVTSANSAKVLNFLYSGTQEISELQLSFAGNTNYTGGAFPGTSGNCGILISGPCRIEIDFDFSQETLGSNQGTIQYSFNNGKESQPDQKLTYQVLLAETNQTLSKSQKLDSLTSFHRTQVIGNKYYALDTKNSRLLIWSAIPTELTPVLWILGQDEDYGRSPNRGARRANASSFFQPEDFDSDGTRLVLADTQNHRILIWNQLPSQHYQKADVVLGQQDFTQNLPNQGLAELSGTTLNLPSAVKIIGDSLFVSDTGNHRVLKWNQFPTTNNQPPDIVLGQSDLSTNSINFDQETVNASGLFGPKQIAATDAQLFLTDANNYRVLVFTRPINTNGQPASFAIGQADLTTGTASPTAADNNFSFPCGILLHQDQLLISDFQWHRILSFALPITASNPSANKVLGQTDFTTNSSSPNLNGFHSPCHMASSETRLMVSDSNNFRIVNWPNLEATEANSIIGQSDTTIRGPFQQELGSRSTLHPVVSNSGNKVIVADAALNRVQVWNDSSTLFSADADALIGQTSASENVSLVGPQNLSVPQSAAMNSSFMLIADTGNNRVLVFNDVNSINQVDASAVLGQVDLYSNVGGTSINQLQNPSSVCITASHTFIADTGNNRILRFTLPLSTNQNADLVLGQVDFDTGTSYGVSEDPNVFGMNQPQGIYCDDTQLMIADVMNHRIAYWKPLPDANAALPTFTIRTWTPTESQTTQANYLNRPMQASVFNEALYVLDSGHNRILKWSSLPTAALPPDLIIGQKNNITPSKSDHLQGPGSLAQVGDFFYIGEIYNQRILKLPTSIFDVSTPPSQ